MSVEALTIVFRHSASTGAARLVLLAMADEASSEGYLTAYRRSQSWFARKANVDARTVRRAIDTLVELGEVEVLTVGDGRTLSDYRLILPGLGSGGEDPIDRHGEPTPRAGTSPTPRAGTSPGGEGDTPAPSSRSHPLDSRSGRNNAREQLSLVPVETPPAERPSGVTHGSDADVWFDRFWSVFPRREGKGQARRAWATARRRGIPAEKIILGAERYRDDPNRDPGFTRLPATWLNGEDWDADPLPARRPNPAPKRSAMGTTMDSARALMASGAHRQATAPALETGA